jgi:predicted ester cyclase
MKQEMSDSTFFKQATTMAILSNKAIVIRFNKEFLEKGNVEVLKEIVADDFINHTADSTVPNNVEGLKQFIAMLHKGFSGIRIDIHEQVGENDLVATRKTIWAMHTGEIMGHPPTGKQVIFRVMDFVRLRDGKYIEHWGQNNIMQVIQQL